MIFLIHLLRAGKRVKNGRSSFIQSNIPHVLDAFLMMKISLPISGKWNKSYPNLVAVASTEMSH